MSKQIVLSLTAVILSALVAGGSAQAAQPLIRLGNHSGFTPPEYGRNEVCEVYSDHVQITTNYGWGDNRLQTTETRKAFVTGTIMSVFKLAEAEAITKKDNGMCDGPSSSVTAQAPGAAEPFVIFMTGGCGTPSQEREGPYSRMLLGIVQKHCPTLFRGFGQ